jgi:protein-disulfide isomerase
MSTHIICLPETATRASELFSSKFKGRILSQEDNTVLEQALLVANKTKQKIIVYDVSRMTDKLKALKRGIRKTPAVIINGKRYERVEEIQEVLQTIS